MFVKYRLECAENLFASLFLANDFERFSNHRLGAIVVAPLNNMIPIVRTTTAYSQPSQHFSSHHYDLIDRIKTMANMAFLQFNNAMVEVYDSRYTNMKFHTDQALDLAPDSYICLFSCYENEQEPHVRKLKFKEKNSRLPTCSEIPLEHNSFVLFSTETNRRYLHKIVSEGKTRSRWLGVTFRQSKTYVQTIDDTFYFEADDQKLTRATACEKTEFFKYKRQENTEIDYHYPTIHYTLGTH